MTNQWRLYYKDSNSNNQVLAGLNDEDLPSDAYSIKQARWKTRNRSIDKLGLIAEGDMFKNVPREENNDFGPAFSIKDVNTTNDIFVVSGNKTEFFTSDQDISVNNSTGNDGNYTVSSVSYDSTNNETDITVNEDVTDSTADGKIYAGEPAIFWTGRRFQTAITGVDTTNDEFVVSGDRTNDFEEGGHIEVIGSTGNDGIYKVADPSDVTYDSNNDETTIAVVEDVTDSTADGDLEAWENIFRGWPDSQGKITEQGVLKLTLFDFIKYLGMQEVNVSTTGTIKDAMSNLTPSDYTLDTPSSSNVDYIDSTGTTTSGFAPLDDWSLTNVDRAAGFREMIRDYGYVLKAKANKELRYEPVGYGSSIDTIDSPAEGDTSNTQGNWKEWTAGDTSVANLVNTARVVNSKSGTKYDSGILTNSTSVNKYGKQTPKGGNPVKKGYVSSDTEAKRVARNIIRDSQNPTEGGRIKVPGRYTNNVSNSSFTLNDSTRDISSEVFVAWSQVNFYPENKTILEMEFENQDENETNLTDDIRAERSITFQDTSTGATGQTSSESPADSGLIGENAPGTGGLIGENAPGTGGLIGENAPGTGGLIGENTATVSGSTTSEGIGIASSEGSGSFSSVSLSSGSFTQLTSFSYSGRAEAARVYELTLDSSGTGTGHVLVRIEQGGNLVAQESIRVFDDDSVIRNIPWFPNLSTSDTVTVDALSGQVGSVDGSVEVFAEQTHSHTSDTLGADNHPHDADASDSTLDVDSHPHDADAGSSTLDVDSHPHDADAGSSTLDVDSHPHDADDGTSTLETDSHPHDANTLSVDTAQEDKTDR
ncbi:MAG: hypothetical protein ABEJ56_00150 [Candidatus Nanohaloarchaea archaeon]